MSAAAWIDTLPTWQAWTLAVGLIAMLIIIGVALRPQQKPDGRRPRRRSSRLFGGR